MRFGIFYEHQLPRPWQPDDEHRLLTDALEQVAIADKAGIDYVWAVEHHFLEEYSHSSAPEVFLAAASQRTSKIRLGHGIVQAPALVNHPARIAERVATLDLVSGGRVEFGTGEASSAAELGGFGVPRDAKRAMWEESLDAVTKMFTEDPFAGYDGAYLKMPPRNVVPKPLQKPHPPLWVACSRRETIHLAARCGIGALSFSFAEPEDAAKWVTEYYDLIASDECLPRGFAVNPNVAVVLPMMLHADESTAIERGIDGAHFFGYALGHFYGGSHHVGGTDLWESFGKNRAESGFARQIVAPTAAPLAVRLLEAGLGSLRGAIGTPAQVTELLARYDKAGVDQVIFVMQAGKTRHEHICESIELFASEVLPAFTDGREEREQAKADRLADAIGQALARRPAARSLSEPYQIDEDAELAAARSGQGQLRGLAAQAGRSAARTAGSRGQAGFRKLVAGSSDARLNRMFGGVSAQRMLFTQMARHYDAEQASGFAGSIVYELGLRDGTVRPWTIEVADGKAHVLAGKAAEPTLVIGMSLADFLKVMTQVQDALTLIGEGKLTMDGDLAVAGRLAEMFGARSPY